jgi:hypothetical protein
VLDRRVTAISAAAAIDFAVRSPVHSGGELVARR